MTKDEMIIFYDFKMKCSFCLLCVGIGVGGYKWDWEEHSIEDIGRESEA